MYIFPQISFFFNNCNTAFLKMHRKQKMEAKKYDVTEVRKLIVQN
jgi:hypothetical protein